MEHDFYLVNTYMYIIMLKLQRKDVLLSQDYNESTNMTHFLKKLWLLLVGSIVRTSFFANQTQGGAKTVPTNPFQR